MNLSENGLQYQNEPYFNDAIETLQQLKTTFSPLEKLLVVRNTFEQMTQVSQSFIVYFFSVLLNYCILFILGSSKTIGFHIFMDNG